MKKRILTLALATSLAASVLTGCGGQPASPGTGANTPTPSASASATPSAQPEGYNGSDNLKVSENPATMTLFSAFGGNGAPKSDMPVWQKAAEITNITVENIANESISDDQQSFSTMLASGQLPDIIQGQRIILSPVLAQGVFISLNELIDQYAPNIKKFLEDFPDAVNAGTGPDGKLYTLTGTLGGEPGKALPSMGFFIRQDWLDTLGLKTPTTLEEFKNVLYAFRNNDPNGNQKKDEIPYFYRDKGVWPLLQLWDAHNEWYVGADDKVHFGRMSAEYKEALIELAQWYKDGIIDPEVFTRGSQARQFLLGNDLGGVTVDWFASTGQMNDSLKEQNSKLNFVAMAPPADVNGAVKIDQSRAPIHAYAWGISRDCKDPVTAIKYLDFWFSESGTLLRNFGIEGEHYEIVNGEPTPLEVALSHPAGFPNFLRSIGAGYEIGAYGSLVAEVITMNKQAKEGFEMYEKSTWIQPPFPTLVLNEEEQKLKDANWTNIMALSDEYLQSALMGAVDIEATWESHLAQLDKMNLSKVVEGYNSAYERYKVSGK